MGNLSVNNWFSYTHNFWSNDGNFNFQYNPFAFVFNPPPKEQDTVNDFSIPGLSVEKAPTTDKLARLSDKQKTQEPQKPQEPTNQTHHASKHSKIRATAKDTELLKKHNASLDKNDPNANAQFVDGNVEVYVSALKSKVPIEGDYLEAPNYIRITDNTNGNRHSYFYYKLTPENRDGKHFAKFGKNLPIDQNQFKEGETYYILAMAVDEDAHERIDYTDHLEIYRLDFSYDADSDTCNYNLIQDETLQGSGRSSVKYKK